MGLSAGRGKMNKKSVLVGIGLLLGLSAAHAWEADATYALSYSQDKKSMVMMSFVPSAECAPVHTLVRTADANSAFIDGELHSLEHGSYMLKIDEKVEWDIERVGYSYVPGLDAVAIHTASEFSFIRELMAGQILFVKMLDDHYSFDLSGSRQALTNAMRACRDMLISNDDNPGYIDTESDDEAYAGEYIAGYGL